MLSLPAVTHWLSLLKLPRLSSSHIRSTRWHHPHHPPRSTHIGKVRGQQDIRNSRTLLVWQQDRKLDAVPRPPSHRGHQGPDHQGDRLHPTAHHQTAPQKGRTHHKAQRVKPPMISRSILTQKAGTYWEWFKFKYQWISRRTTRPSTRPTRSGRNTPPSSTPSYKPTNCPPAHRPSSGSLITTSKEIGRSALSSSAATHSPKTHYRYSV